MSSVLKKADKLTLSLSLQEMPQPSVTEISLKITYPKICLNLSGANELMMQFNRSQSTFSQTYKIDNPVLVFQDKVWCCPLTLR